MPLPLPPAQAREITDVDFEAALARFEPLLRRRACTIRIHGDDVDRGDLLQACRITLWRLMRRGHEVDHPDFEPYLNVALTNGMYQHLQAKGLDLQVRRGKIRKIELDAPLAGDDGEMPGFQLADTREADLMTPENLDRALRRLPRALRWVFEDRYLHELSVAAIARQQRESEAEIRNRLDRATAAVVEILRTGPYAGR